MRKRSGICTTRNTSIFSESSRNRRNDSQSGRTDRLKPTKEPPRPKSKAAWRRIFPNLLELSEDGSDLVGSRPTAAASRHQTPGTKKGWCCVDPIAGRRRPDLHLAITLRVFTPSIFHLLLLDCRVREEKQRRERGRSIVSGHDGPHTTSSLQAGPAKLTFVISRLLLSFPRI